MNLLSGLGHRGAVTNIVKGGKTTRDVLYGNKKIGSLHSAKARGLEIEGLWINYPGAIEDQAEAYTLKDVDVTYNGCWLTKSTESSNGSYVEFQATNKTGNPIQKPKRFSLIPNR